MASKNTLKETAIKIGSAAGKIDGRTHRAAHKAAKAAHVLKGELAELTKQVNALKKQLKKSSSRLKTALK